MLGQGTAARNGQTRSAPSATETDKPWLLCRAGRLLGALPVEHVIEIMRALPLEPFAGAPAYVRGVSIIRGAPVPVVDIGLLIGGEITHAARLVTVRTASRKVALAVERVIGVTTISSEVFGQLPPLLEEAAADTIVAIGARDCELLVFLRTGRLVSEDVLARLDAEGAVL